VDVARPRCGACPPLQDGAGQQYLHAQVTITFDNSDGRLPVDSNEVTLGRTVGLKKDEHFLNNKPVKKSDIANILESAGFSRSNPYYIVAQGKVQALTTLTDK
jgi:structural maintenance of chromosome 3 (chondroitin sulfate proteoglycan 6)